ncbi:protease modulator HflC [Halalkalibacterium halodurans]|jgi:membrane protease subunit HflC|uniref:Protein HflC n=2 Tax=Halalkalibacterium halodurans TaxID=86665 RepID=A0A0M0KH27_ALKHA|nr:protease modulator HflC [Halalkalibacterium halodurans]MDY7223687.1 protease modulator HflC [Halalkalibacterium halodurans]MDY7242908.1 protease modulator HflC [Halalkalibacterium halodurans]MED3645645.1 protease modulator HflC [Halalkalibacterium halodurans]TES58211.1 protease modulator HflC [Halalkalibacterium halodurans]TPE69914.1 protease modulator HflC [Halalkalibacterium halodurans]
MSDDKIINFDEKRPPVELRKYVQLGSVAVLLIGIVGIILSNLFIVEQGEYKVVRQFGEVVRVESEPGLKFKIPFIQSVSTLPKYQMIYDIPPAEINTRDKKRMLADHYALWRIEDPLRMISNVGSLQGAEAILGEQIFSAIRAELGQLEFDEIINEEENSRGDFNQQVKERVNSSLERQDLGIVLLDVRMKRTDLPKENEEAVYRRMISERESIAQDYLSQGDAEANRIRARTDQEVTEILAKAKADAEEIIGAGEAEAAEIYNESFGRDPEFYQLYRTLLSYEKTIGDQTVIVLPADSPYARILMGYTD